MPPRTRSSRYASSRERTAKHSVDELARPAPVARVEVYSSPTVDRTTRRAARRRGGPRRSPRPPRVRRSRRPAWPRVRAHRSPPPDGAAPIAVSAPLIASHLRVIGGKIVEDCTLGMIGVPDSPDRGDAMRTSRRSGATCCGTIPPIATMGMPLYLTSRSSSSGPDSGSCSTVDACGASTSLTTPHVAPARPRRDSLFEGVHARPNSAGHGRRHDLRRLEAALAPCRSRRANARQAERPRAHTMSATSTRSFTTSHAPVRSCSSASVSASSTKRAGLVLCHARGAKLQARRVNPSHALRRAHVDESRARDNFIVRDRVQNRREDCGCAAAHAAVMRRRRAPARSVPDGAATAVCPVVRRKAPLAGRLYDRDPHRAFAAGNDHPLVVDRLNRTRP